MAEYMDIVDEEDYIIGRATRQEMRKKNLLHRGVYIIVKKSTGEIFVHQRSESKNTYPLCWDVTFGGGVQSGETYEAAARRELF